MIRSSLIYFLLLTLPVLTQCTATKEEDKQKPAAYTIEQFMNTEDIAGSAFSPDEQKIMYNSKKTGIYNAYEMPVDSGESKPLTQSETNATFGLSYFPADERILFTSDEGGNEINHLFVQSLQGKATDLTPDSTAKANFMGWSDDKKSLFYASNQRNPQAFDVYQVPVSQINKIENNVTAYQPERIFKNDGRYFPGPISPDQKYMALTESVTRQQVHMYLQDLQTGKIKRLNDKNDTVAYDPQYFSKDGKKLYFLSDKDSAFTDLSSYNLETGAIEKIEEAKWDMMYAYLSENGKYRVTAINKDASTRIKVFNTATGMEVEMPKFPEGEITSVNISDSEDQMAFYVNSSTSPNNLYLYDFGSGLARRLTTTMSPDIREEDLVQGEVIRYPSFDGMEIPALLYKPKGLAQGEKVPALLYVHGGPGGQSRLNYNPLIQYLVNHGYAILAVNNRGSSGYGKTFYAADDQKHGKDDLEDCVEAKQYLAQQDYIDPQKIGILGGSYGGYMTLAALAFKPDVFTVGVDLFGVANWLRTLKSIPPWWGAARESLFAEMGNPQTDSAALYEKSPLFFADQITQPLIVLQGANDPRVLKVESDEIVEAVKANGVPVEYVVFDDEGHGFLKKENQIKGYKAILDFLDEHLKKDQEAGS